MEKTHGMSRTPIYHTWVDMKQRVFNKKDKRHSRYGGRGITIEKEWMHFENFYRDMGKKPKKLSLDRINNDGNYCKENCRWANKWVQAGNRSTTKYLTYNGVTQFISEWSRKLGISPSTISIRLKNGWTIEEILAPPNSRYIRNSIITQNQDA